MTAWPVFAIVLEARAPERNHLRRYDLQAGEDMFGGWIVETRFGRIGTQGRRLHRMVETEGEARRMVRRALVRRRSAPSRIGTAYVAVEILDTAGWLAGEPPFPSHH